MQIFPTLFYHHIDKVWWSGTLSHVWYVEYSIDKSLIDGRLIYIRASLLQIIVFLAESNNGCYLSYLEEYGMKNQISHRLVLSVIFWLIVISLLYLTVSMVQAGDCIHLCFTILTLYYYFCTLPVNFFNAFLVLIVCWSRHIYVIPFLSMESFRWLWAVRSSIFILFYHSCSDVALGWPLT